MTTILDYACDVPAAKQTIGKHGVSMHWGLLSTWSVVGLALSGVMVALGFGAELVRALAAG